MRRVILILAALAGAANTASAAAQGLDHILPHPIGTAEFERGVLEAFARTRHDRELESVTALDRADLARLEPLHNEYLIEVLRIRDDDGAPLHRSFRSLHEGAPIQVMRAQARRVESIRARVADAERRLFDRIESALPEGDRAGVASFRRARERAILRFPLRGYQASRSLDLVEVVSRAQLAEIDREAVRFELESYEERFLAALRRLRVTLLRSEESLLRQLEPFAEQLAAIDWEDPEERESYNDLARPIFKETYAGYRAALRELDDFNRRAVSTVLALPSAAGRRALRRVLLPSDRMWTHQMVNAMELVGRRASALPGLTDEQRMAVTLAFEAWVVRDNEAIDRLVAARDRTLQAQEEASAASDTPPDAEQRSRADAVRTAWEECNAAMQARALEADRGIREVLGLVGESNAAALGLRLRRRTPESQPLLTWNDPDQPEAVGTALLLALGEAERPLGLRSGVGFGGSPLPLAALEAWSRDLAFTAAEADLLRSIHSDYLLQWERAVVPLGDVVRELRQAQSQPAPVEDGNELSAEEQIHERIAAAHTLAEARRALLPAFQSADASLFNALAAQLGSEERSTMIAALRFARMWSSGGPGSGLESHWTVGEGWDVNAGAVALSSALSEPARRALAQSLRDHGADITEVQRTFVDAAVTLSWASDVLHAAGRAGPHQAPSERELSIAGERDHGLAVRSWTRVARKQSRLLREIARDAEAQLDGEDRRSFRAVWQALIHADLVRDPGAASPWIERILALMTLTPEERTAVEAIATEHRQMSDAAIDAMIAASTQPVDAVESDPTHRDSGKAINWWLHGAEVDRWRFERSEANEKALMHLRVALSPETLARLPALADGWRPR